MALSEVLAAVACERVAGCSVLLLVACLVDFATLPRCPDQIPTLGFGLGIWAHVRNSIAYFTRHKAWVEEGYAKYNKKGLPFAISAAISRPADIVLPRSLVSWLFEQPDDVLSAHCAHNEVLFGDYNFLSQEIAHGGFGGRVLAKSLPRHLPSLIPAVDEIQHAAGLALAHVTKDEWASVNLWQLWLEMVPRVTNTHMPAAPRAAWTKAALASLVRLDSSIRESQRVSNFADMLIERVVVAPAGLRHPDFAWTLPRGAFVTVNLEGTHHDDDLHANARAYDPLRFSRVRESARAAGDAAEPDDRERATAARALGMVTTSEWHLAFGHGRHACPGRFFVAHELKLIMAHLLVNYDLKGLERRLQPCWIGPTTIPPLGARIELRRKRRPVAST